MAKVKSKATNPLKKGKSSTRGKAKKRKTQRVTIKTSAEKLTGVLNEEYLKDAITLNKLQTKYDKLSVKLAAKKKQMESYRKDVASWERHKETKKFQQSPAAKKAWVDKWIKEKGAKAAKYEAEWLKLQTEHTALRNQMVKYFNTERFDAFTKYSTFVPGKIYPTSYRAIKSNSVLKKGQVLFAHIYLNVPISASSRGEISAGTIFPMKIITDGKKRVSELVEEYFETAEAEFVGSMTDMDKKGLYDVRNVFIVEDKPVKLVPIPKRKR